MKLILAVAVFFIAAIVFPTKTEAKEEASASSARLISNAVSTQNTGDLRSVALQNVFEKYNSPLVDASDSYIKYADTYNIDWKLLPSISGLESTFGKFLMPGSHNAYGWGGGHIYFESWDEGIETITKSLKDRYVDRGARTLHEVGSIYAESPTWALRVNSFMDEFNREYIRLTQNALVTI